MKKNNIQENFIFNSKSDTLAALLACSNADLHIPEFFTVTVFQWRQERDTILKKIISVFPHTFLAIRSSSLREDTNTTSGAGAFSSLLHIPSDDFKAIAEAIDTVIHSYGRESSDENSLEDQVLIQAMVQNISLSGVITTRVLTDGSPYYVINYDDECNHSNRITGGIGNGKTVYVFRDAVNSDFDSPRLCSFVQLARQVENLCGQDALDIEFCQDSNGVLYLLQVRPLCTQVHWIADADVHIHHNIGYVSKFIESRMCHWPEIYGQRTILGVMPDWNPAEMIGITPRQLSSSLYRELITSQVWKQAREMMGYRTMPPNELMLLVGGRPYIDVRTSFNSFLPAGLDAITCEILVSSWIDRLERNPHLHDKVEFEIAQTSLDFCFDQHLDERYPQLLTQKRRKNFNNALKNLTLNCLTSKGTFEWALEASLELRNRQVSRPLAGNELHHISQETLLPTIQLLLEECKMYGTLPFSILARHAFIAEALLRTAVKRNALLPERLTAFKRSIHTVLGEMSSDFLDTCRGCIDKNTFMHRYGHLRPNSYDILSPRYLDREGLLTESNILKIQEVASDFTFTEKEQHNISQLLMEAGLGQISIAQLEHYARATIAGRESAKFIFTRNLSDIIEYLSMWGKSYGLSREDISFFDVRDVLEWTTQSLLRPAKEYFQECVDKGRMMYNLGRSFKLGYLIRSARDMYVVPQHRSAPNFVGQGAVESSVFLLLSDTPCTVDISGKIICIENADPGFDWIFTRQITGLITKFGGTNSHMAIRCAEYGLPAAIGVGDRLFEQIINANQCRLNAGSCSLQII